MANGGERRRRTGKLQRNRPTQLHFEHLEDRRVMAVVINEFLADNQDGIRDAAGHRHDWIELKNTGVAAVDISGWYLTDSSANLTKFQIPTNGALSTLDPGEILLVFASGNNGEVGWVGNELHTNFQLSQEPGFLALVQANGTTIEDEYNLYPQQDADVSYGVGVTTGSSVVDTFVNSGTAVRVIAPTSANQARDDNWKNIGFDTTGWIAGTGSVGFDRNADGINLAPYINTTLTAGQMAETTTSAYVRYAFNVTSPEQLTSLSMDLRFDDGFIAYLNGREIARANFAEDFVRPQPQWDSFAGNQLGTSSSSGAANRVAEATDLVVFDLTKFLPFLEAGQNVLAFHGVNSNSSASSNTNRQDFLIQPVLTATRATGATQEGFLASPTPGWENGIATQGVVADTSFSVDRGFFDAPFLVDITTATPGASIRYTLDGSLPTETTGTLYAGPINITTTTILRAIAFKSGFTSTNVDTQTYIFLDDVLQQDASYVTQPYETWGRDKGDGDTASGYNRDDESDWEMDPGVVDGNEATVKNALLAIPTMSLVMDWDDLFSGTPLPGTFPAGSNVAPAPQGIYIHGSSSERASSLEYFNPDLPTDQFQIDAAVEMQGHSSTLRWNADKMSFQVKFKAPYGPNELNYDLFGDTPSGANATTQFNTLILDAMFNYSWHHSNITAQANFARFVTDQVTADLQNAASGIGAAHGKYVHLYINGLYWGLYNAHERPDEQFTEEYYGGDKDNVYVIKHANTDVNNEFTWVEGGIAAEQAYLNMLSSAAAAGAAPTNLSTFQMVEQILDVDQFIDYMIVHYYAGGGADWSHNNWYATFDSVDPNGRWRFHAWDQEHAFPTTDNGDAWDQNSNLTTKDDFQTPTAIHRDLILHQEYRVRFADRVQELMYNDGVLTSAAAQAAYEYRTNEIDQAIIGESARWGDNRENNSGKTYTRTDFINVKNALLAAFFPVRTSNVLGHFDGAGWIPTLDAPNFNQYGGEVASGFDLTISNPNGSGSIYYTLDGSDPRLEGGTLSGSAILYAGAIDITAGVQVKARIFNSAISGTANDWSPLVDKTFTLEESFPLRIVELHYNPAGSEEVTEFIELLNYGDETISLDGVKIGGFASTAYSFQSGQSLGAGQRIVVARNPSDFTLAYGGGINLATGPGYAEQNLSNGGELVTLLGPVGELLQSFTYGDSNVAGWPVTPDGDGPSLEYIGPLTGTEDPTQGSPLDPFDNPANWQASANNGGSPGTSGAALPDDADFNNDNEVSGLDFLAWQINFGITSGATLAQGDANHDGAVDSDDLVVWETQYGNPPPLVAAITTGGDEPAVVAVFASSVTDGDLTAYAAQLSADSAPRDEALEESAVDELFLEAAVSTPDVPAGSGLSTQDEALIALAYEDEAAAEFADLESPLDEALV